MAFCDLKRVFCMWLRFCTLSLIIVTEPSAQDCLSTNSKITEAKTCLETVSQSLEKGDLSLLQPLENTLSTMSKRVGNTPLSVGRFVCLLYRIHFFPLTTVFEGLNIYAIESNAATEMIPDTIMRVQIPKQVPVDRTHSFAFYMVSLPQNATTKLVKHPEEYLYLNRMVGMSVENRKVSGLQEFVNITINVTTSINNDIHTPQCVFLNYSTYSLDTDGCLTHWMPGESHIVCSCNHLTFFAVLMISNQKSSQVSPTDVNILTYITFIGCSISFCALLISVLLFTIKRNIRSDVSMKIHINLAIALLLLNMHFLPSTAVGIWNFSWPSPWLCFYMALALHFSLLASYSWMAVEGFHLYLLLVKVFNIYVKKYLLKLSLVGWVVIIDKNAYGPVYISNTTEICYIRYDLIKYVTTVGLFSLVFLFNLIMLMVTVRNILSMRKSKQFGPNDCNRAKKDICTLLGVITLLGTTWGLIFFSFGQLSTIGIYAFSILNPLQGLFVFLWFVMSVIKIGKATSSNTATQSSHG